MWGPRDRRFPDPPRTQESCTPPQSAFGAAYSYVYSPAYASAYNLVYSRAFTAAFECATAATCSTATDRDPDPDPDLGPSSDPDPTSASLAHSASLPCPGPSSTSSSTFPRPAYSSTFSSHARAHAFAHVQAHVQAHVHAHVHAHAHAHSLAFPYAEPYGPRALATARSPGDSETPPRTPPSPPVSPPATRLLRDLPDNVWRSVFGHLLERDLCRASQVCRRFARLADDPELWRQLYEGLYEYDRPLINPAPCHFQFCARELSGAANPWRESFRRLYHGVHVRPGFGAKATPGRSVRYFDSVHAALAACHRRLFPAAPGQRAVVFVHRGTYRERPLVVRANVALIGAAAGNAPKSVVIECESGTTLRFAFGATMAYAGYLTLKLSPPQTSAALHLPCLEVSGDCSPTIEHCIIRSSFAVSPAVRVRGPNAHPDILFCTITDCHSVGLSKEDESHGMIEDNLINMDLCDPFTAQRH